MKPGIPGRIMWLGILRTIVKRNASQFESQCKNPMIQYLDDEKLTTQRWRRGLAKKFIEPHQWIWLTLDQKFWWKVIVSFTIPASVACEHYLWWLHHLHKLCKQRMRTFQIKRHSEESIYIPSFRFETPVIKKIPRSVPR